MFNTNIAAGLLSLGWELEFADNKFADDDKEVEILVPYVEDIEVDSLCKLELAQALDLLQLLGSFECFLSRCLHEFEVC